MLEADVAAIEINKHWQALLIIVFGIAVSVHNAIRSVAVIMSDSGHST